jgi:hypothetical protein
MFAINTIPLIIFVLSLLAATAMNVEEDAVYSVRKGNRSPTVKVQRILQKKNAKGMK